MSKNLKPQTPQVDTSAIDAAAMMGGSGIEPYEALIPGGKEVRVSHTIRLLGPYSRPMPRALRWH